MANQDRETGDGDHSDVIRRRSDEETQRELDATREVEELPGGAEGGEDSNSANWLVDHPADTDPLGDTDQHSSEERLPPHRERAHREHQTQAHDDQ
jgi:hypothetical protein